MLKRSFFICIFLMSSIPAYSQYGGGTGEPNTPYQIADVNDFQTLCATPTDWNKFFILTADVDLTGLTFTQSPIAPDTRTDDYFQGTPFTGIFDGKGYTISNLKIAASEKDYIGLFGCAGGQICNLSVGNVNVTGSGRVGGLVGSNSGSITSCYATGTVSGIDGLVGGLVGSNGGKITFCYATGTVSGGGTVGGLVGYNFLSITSCHATGAVGGSFNVGGLAGKNEHGSITSCYATGEVSDSGDYSDSVGGLVGSNNLGRISDCYSTGPVSGDHNVGGLVGLSDFPTSSITSCYATGSVTGVDYVGGLVGWNRRARLTSCYATGEVSGIGHDVGGLVGYIRNASAAYCFWDIETSGQPTSAGGTGKTTSEMQTQSTFTDARWDFVDEIINGTDDLWFIRPNEYPKLHWQNNKPVADAGDGQTLYADFRGIVSVSLDGSQSTDPDNDLLVYNWSWTIDDITYTAEGVNPLVELSAGEHLIALTVSDGFDTSEPSQITIVVVEAVQCKTAITTDIEGGDMLMRIGGHEKIKALLELPTGLTKGSIDTTEPIIIYANDVEGPKALSQTFMFKAGKTYVTVLFDKKTVLDLVRDVPCGDAVDFTAEGLLNDGRYFYGHDDLKVIHKYRCRNGCIVP